MAELIGHELQDWLPQELNQGPPFPEWLKIFWPWYTPPAAEFRVSALVISPAEVNPGQTVMVSCTVENIGSEAGSYTVKLRGDFMAEQTVTLGPGESKVVSFQVTPTVAKSYNVTVDGLSGTFRVTEAPVADIRVEDLVIQPPEIIVGGKVVIAVTATNCGNASGSKKIVCTVT